MGIVCAWILQQIDKHKDTFKAFCHRRHLRGKNIALTKMRCQIAFTKMYYKYDAISRRLTLWWRHNEHDSVSNHQPHDFLFNRLFRRRSKKTSKLRVTGLCAGNSPGTGEFPAQMASNVENVSIWWRHHEYRTGIFFDRNICLAISSHLITDAPVNNPLETEGVFRVQQFVKELAIVAMNDLTKKPIQLVIADCTVPIKIAVSLKLLVSLQI